MADTHAADVSKAPVSDRNNTAMDDVLASCPGQQRQRSIRE